MCDIWNLSAICRCCHSDGQLKSLKRPYVVNNDVEIYSSMLRDTFGIIIDPPSRDISYSVCEECVQELRRAAQFKKQVIICEAKFEEYCKNEESQMAPGEIKLELESDDGSDENDIFFEVKDENRDCVKEEKAEIKTEVPDGNKMEITIDTTNPKRKRNSGSKKDTQLLEEESQTKLLVKLENGVYSCEICGRCYKLKRSLKKHISSKHCLEKYTCKTCRLEFENKKEMDSHRTAVHKSKYPCSYCNKIFQQKYNLHIHLKRHTKQSLFECDYCNKKFMHKKSLLHHINALHLGVPIHKKMCEICGRGFNDITNLRNHAQTVHEKLKPFKCQYCPKNFTAKKHLLVHERVHTGERPYSCDECEQAFTCLQYLKQHKARAHCDEPYLYSCKLCDAKFVTRRELCKHSRCHSGSKPLLCHLCNKDFACKYSLKRHVMEHSGEKKHECDVCFQKFVQKMTLVRHKKRMHSGKVVVKKPCHLCKRKVIDLEKHLDKHNNKPFECNYCSKRYPLKNALNRHVANVHFGRKAHACDLCDQKYVHQSTLVKHKLKVHKIESKIEKGEIVEDCVTYLNENKVVDVKLNVTDR